jgi:putative transposase
MAYSKGSHTIFYYRYHIVWATKYRYKVLCGPMRERIRDDLPRDFSSTVD